MPLSLPLMKQKQEQVYSSWQIGIWILCGLIKTYSESNQIEALLIWDLYVNPQKREVIEIEKEHTAVMAAIFEEKEIDDEYQMRSMWNENNIR